MASVIRVLAGVSAGQLVAAYVAFALLPDAGPASHRVLFVVWVVATAAGTTAGVIWARLNRERFRRLQDQ